MDKNTHCSSIMILKEGPCPSYSSECGRLCFCDV